MTIADSRVVGYQYRRRGIDEKWYDCNKMFFDRESELHLYETRELIPLCLLAEADHKLQRMEAWGEQWKLNAIDNAKERDALQSRLDAVAGLADALAERGAYPHHISDDYKAGQLYGFRASANKLRAALGCATTGEGGE